MFIVKSLLTILALNPNKNSNNYNSKMTVLFQQLGRKLRSLTRKHNLHFFKENKAFIKYKHDFIKSLLQIILRVNRNTQRTTSPGPTHLLQLRALYKKKIEKLELISYYSLTSTIFCLRSTQTCK